MSLLKYHPLSRLSQFPFFSKLSDDIEQFWDQDLPSLNKQLELSDGRWIPEVDIQQSDGKYLVKADIPGVAPKDISVSMDNNNLIIEGKRESEIDEKKDDYRRIERSYGSFYRRFNLPDASDGDDIVAKCHNGVLEVSIPKKESSTQKKIEVKVN